MNTLKTISILDTRFAADLLAQPEYALRDLVAGRAELGYFAAGEPADIVADLVAEGGKDYLAAVLRGAEALFGTMQNCLLHKNGKEFLLCAIRTERLFSIVRRVIIAAQHSGPDVPALIAEVEKLREENLRILAEASGPRGDYRNKSACRAARDGDCMWEHCPQIRDDEPRRTGRHCPLDMPPFRVDEEEI